MADANTTYFLTHFKSRVTQNTIIGLTIIDGVRVKNQDGIEDKVTNFYKKLPGEAAQRLPSVNSRVMWHRVSLN